jgi:peptide-methionine (S)-S-oxide reductase
MTAMLAAVPGVNGADVTGEGTNQMAEIQGRAETEVASFGMGCFWCGEAVFEQLDGVVAVRSGYQGGHVADPSYEQVCTGNTGHAEVIQVEFDPARVTYDDLLDLFWRAHDPTQLNRQGNDVGTQYRSAIFTYGEAQQRAAEASKRAQTAGGHFDNPIVTEIVPAPPFYVAEADHQDFYDNNRGYPYCRFVIAPKLKKLGMKP